MTHIDANGEYIDVCLYAGYVSSLHTVFQSNIPMYKSLMVGYYKYCCKCLHMQKKNVSKMSIVSKMSLCIQILDRLDHFSLTFGTRDCLFFSSYGDGCFIAQIKCIIKEQNNFVFNMIKIFNNLYYNNNNDNKHLAHIQLYVYKYVFDQ